MPEPGIRDRSEPDSLGGRYQCIAKLGAGGMSEVFLASARGLRSFHKLVVIKRMLASTIKVKGSEKMFMDEAEIAARFNHPNIVQTYEIVNDAEHLSIVMEFLEGQPLDGIFDLRDREGVSRSVLTDRNLWVRVIADALKGLHYAHELRDYDGQPLNIVHRDISPQNLFLTYDGVVKIVDFGIAKAALSSIKTEVGTIKGKIGYMAPEQAMCAPVDRRTDIFSTGVVLWEFIAGRRMRRGDVLGELQKLVSDATPALSTVVADVPSALEAIVAKATARNPDDRYASAQEMRLALEEYLAGQESTLTTADVGQVISQHFEQDRRFLRERVRASISGTPPGGAAPSGTLVSSAPPRGATTSGTLGGFPGSRPVPEMPDSSRRRKVIAAAVVCAVALLPVAALWVVPRITVGAHPAAAGAITIESMPTSASVRLDGIELGTTPITTLAGAGTHRVTVSKAGFTEASRTVETKNGETVNLSFALSPVPGAKAPPEPAASGEIESDDKVRAKTDDSGDQGRLKQRAEWRPTQAKPGPKAQPAPSQLNIQLIDEQPIQLIDEQPIQIIDEGLEAKVKVDVIE
jgi:serine/threonine protein kinase